MKLLADENIPLATVVSLRDEGHDVTAVQEIRPGMGDADVLARARREDRVLVTGDLDFGELIFRQRLPPPPAVLLVRVPQGNPLTVGDALKPILAEYETMLMGKFTVVHSHGVRIHPFPSQ